MDGRETQRQYGRESSVALRPSCADPSLGALEGPWTGLPPDYVTVAYAWSLAVIEAVVDADGAGDLERLLDRVGSERSAETAVEQALHANYADLNRMTADYLRKTYLRSAR